MSQNKTIADGSSVIMHMSILLEDGSAADSTKVNNKPAKVILGDGSLSETFEANLKGLTVGEQKKFTLVPEDAFGLPNPDNVHHMMRSQFSQDIPIEIGNIVAFTQPNGQEIPGLIREIAGDSVTVDFNHPLAGQVVIFDVEILEIH